MQISSKSRIHLHFETLKQLALSVAVHRAADAWKITDSGQRKMNLKQNKNKFNVIGVEMNM